MRRTLRKEDNRREYLEALWLNSRGGRTQADVLVDEDGRKFVEMSVGNGMSEKVYIPSSKEIIRMFE